MILTLTLEYDNRLHFLKENQGEIRMIDISEMNVLLVDDYRTMTRSLHRMMKTIGYGKNFQHAHNGKEALRVLRKEPIDLLLMDYNMPEMSGGEALDQLRADRSLRDMPVIMITAQAYQDYVAEAAESYVDAYILKPVTIKVLEAKVSYVVEKANNPPPVVAHLRRAVSFEDEGDLDGAISEAKLAMEADSKSTRAIRDLGYFYYKKGELAEAEKWLLKAAKLNHLDVFAFHHLGEIYLERKDIEKAQDYFEKAMKISPRHLDRGINFGKTLVEIGMHPRAAQVFSEALDLASNPVELREEIADFCLEKSSYQYAAKLLGSILDEHPNQSGISYKLGQALEGMDDKAKAVIHLADAEKADFQNLDIKIHLARDYLDLNRPIWAEKALKRLLKIDSKHKEARELLKLCG